MVINITPQRVKSLLESQKEKVVLLDVRSLGEHREIRIPNSKHIPLDELRHRFRELPRDKKIIVYCRSGNRSAFATYFLRKLGYEAYNMVGGILFWPYEVEGDRVLKD